MTSLSTFAQPSMLDLARAGNFRAIAYLINSYLAPHGIYARVEPVQGGCLQIRVELNSLPNQQELYIQLRDRLTKFICHYIWRLNSEVIDGVRIIGLWGHPARPREPEVLWKQSVRIVTPANQRRKNKPLEQLRTVAQQAGDLVNFKVFRVFLLSGFAVSSFIIGFWISYSDIRAKHQTRTFAPPSTLGQSQGMAPTGVPQKRPKTVQAALETIPVIEHSQVANPTDPTVTLMFSGDVTLGEAFEELIGKDYKWAFDQMPEYREADLAMVNLEDTLTTAETKLEKTFNFKADPEAVEVLAHGGVDIVSLGNNHAMDYQAQGLQETMKTLDRAGIHHIGAGSDIKEARRPKIIDVKGQRIAYLGYYAADFHAAGEGIAGTNHGDNERIAADIRAIRDQVDWIVINFHWGIELANYPEYWQSELAHFAIDNGADLVVGHHPHVLQGAEIYKGRAIAYSLGNFIFGGNSRSDYDTAVLKVSLREKQMKVEFLPVEVRKYQPKVVKGERGDRILSEIALFSDMFEEPMSSPLVLNARDSKVVKAPEKSAFDTLTADSFTLASGNSTGKSLNASPPDNSATSSPQADPFTVSSFISNSALAPSTGQALPLSENSQSEGFYPSFNVSDRNQQGTIVLGGATAATVAALAIGATRRYKKIKLPEFAKTAAGR